MKGVTLTIDGAMVEAAPGDRILWAALDAGIWIPHLCADREHELPFGGCRLCLVEVEGRRTPVASCAEPVAEGMVVRTRTPKIDRLVATAFELLVAAHRVACKTCVANGACGLQEIGKRRGLKLRSKRFSPMISDLPIDDGNPYLTIDPTKCVLCGKCVTLCNEVHGAGVLDFAHRGLRTAVTSLARPSADPSRCEVCRDCIEACPVGALAAKDED